MKHQVRHALADRRPVGWTAEGILVTERDAVIAYALAHSKDGYRRLAWQMLDADIAALRPSSVYWILECGRSALSLETQHLGGDRSRQADAAA